MGTRCKTAAAPATVTGERLSDMPLRRKPREGGRERSSREPGDLPRAVVLFSVGEGRKLRGKPSRRHVGVVVAGPRLDMLFKNDRTPLRAGSWTQTRRMSCANPLFFPLQL